MALLARDVMQKDVAVIDAGASLAELEREFADAGVSGFPVMKAGTAVGIVTLADVVRRLGSRRQAPDETDVLRVEDLMTRPIVAVEPETSILDVARTLVAHQVHRVLVVEDGALVGVLSALDIIALLAHGRLCEA